MKRHRRNFDENQHPMKCIVFNWLSCLGYIDRLEAFPLFNM